MVGVHHAFPKEHIKPPSPEHDKRVNNMSGLVIIAYMI